jgi:hypothetical protein
MPKAGKNRLEIRDCPESMCGSTKKTGRLKDTDMMKLALPIAEAIDEGCLHKQAERLRASPSTQTPAP